MAVNHVQVEQYYSTTYKASRMGKSGIICRKISRNGEPCSLSHIQRGNHCDRCTRCIGPSHETTAALPWFIEEKLFYLCYDCHQDKLANKRSSYDLELVVEYQIEL